MKQNRRQLATLLVLVFLGLTGCAAVRGAGRAIGLMDPPHRELVVAGIRDLLVQAINQEPGQDREAVCAYFSPELAGPKSCPSWLDDIKRWNVEVTGARYTIDEKRGTARIFLEGQYRNGKPTNPVLPYQNTVGLSWRGQAPDDPRGFVITNLNLKEKK